MNRQAPENWPSGRDAKRGLGLAAKIAALSAAMAARAVSFPGDNGFSADISGWSDIDSAYVSKGRTCHDGLVWNPSVTVSDFGYGERRFPAYIGYWGMFSLSDSDKFPKEKPGRWVEADPYAGMDFAKFTGWKDQIALKTWWLRWHFPATQRRSTDMCAFDATLKKCPLHPTTSWRYRFYGASAGRVEIKFGASESYAFLDDWRVFGGLNFWYIDYRNENPAKTSGPSSGDLTAGIGWKMLYFKATYWFQLDPDVLKKDSAPYGYDENLVLAAGVRFAF